MQATKNKNDFHSTSTNIIIKVNQAKLLTNSISSAAGKFFGFYINLEVNMKDGSKATKDYIEDKMLQIATQTVQKKTSKFRKRYEFLQHHGIMGELDLER